MKISYITHHGVAEWLNFEDDGSDMLTISVNPKAEGAITVGSNILIMKNGEARITKSALPSGEYSPKIECDNGVFVAEGFTKLGRVILPMKTSEGRIRALIRRTHRLEELTEQLIGRITALEDLCRGHDIFDFERKEQ